MAAYIDIVSEHVMNRKALSEEDLQEIGDFKREHVVRWLNDGGPSAPHIFRFDLGVYGWKDFHVVCGDVDIPWATEEAKQLWNEVRKAGERAYAINSGKLKSWE